MSRNGLHSEETGAPGIAVMSLTLGLLWFLVIAAALGMIGLSLTTLRTSHQTIAAADAGQEEAPAITDAERKAQEENGKLQSRLDETLKKLEGEIKVLQQGDEGGPIPPDPESSRRGKEPRIGGSTTLRAGTSVILPDR